MKPFACSCRIKNDWSEDRGGLIIKRFFGWTVIFLLSLLYFPTSSFADEQTTPSGVPFSELEDFVDNFTENYIGKTVAGATIVIVKNDEIVFSKGYGYADVENQVPMNPSTSVLEWGSTTKLFVWVAAMQLVEQGKLDLETDIRKEYLPDDFLTKLKYDEPITMLNLMHHNAGFEDYIFDLIFDTPDRVTSLEEALKLTEPKQVYKPGTVVAYSNYSTSLAAFIIEQITNQDFYNYVAENIFSKLEMNQTSIHLPVEENEIIAQNKIEGYVLSGSGELQASDPAYLSLYPSGGANGTAEDLAKFAAGLLPADNTNSPLFQNNKVLQELLTSSYSVHEQSPGIAHGFWEYAGKYRGLTHAGNTIAFSSNFHIVPEDRFAVIVLTNQAGEIDLSYGLIHQLVGDHDVEIAEESMPDSKVVEGSYLSSRRPHSGFLNLYYHYLVPLKIKAINNNQIELNLAGMKADYIQVRPYLYKLIDGHTGFIPNNRMYFHVKDGAVEQISTAYSDYLPMDKSNTFLYLTLAIFVWCLIYFIISPLLLFLRALLRRRKQQPATALAKWNWLLNLSGTAIILNVLSLAVRMLTSPNRSYSELIIHFGLNYLLTVTSLAALIMIAIKWKKAQLTKVQTIGYLLSSISSIGLIAWLIIWQVYF